MSGNRDELTSGGGGIPGRPSNNDETDDGSSSSPTLADRVRDALGGDPVDSGGTNTDTSSSTSGGSGGTTRNPQRGPSGPPNSRQSGGGSLTDQGLGQADALNEQTTDDTDQGALDEAAEAYTENVAQPAGEVVADATPAARAEENLFGTDRTEQVIEGTTTTLAQIGNVPGALAGARDLGQTFVRARRRATDPVTIGGVPTGVTVPNLEGQRENAEAATAFGAQAASNAADRPFRTAGSVFGGVVGGAVAGRATSNAVRRASGSDTVEDFFADRRGTTTGRQRPRGDGDSSGTLIEGDDIRSRPSDPDQGPSAFPDPQGRFQGGAGFNRNNPTRGDVDSPADVDPSGSGDGFGYRSVASEVRTAQRNPGVDSPTGPDLRQTADFGSASSTSSGGGVFGSGAGTGAAASSNGGTSLGEIDATNDPTGIMPDTAFPTGETDTAGSVINDETGGVLDDTNDPTGIGPGGGVFGTTPTTETDGTDSLGDSLGGTVSQTDTETGVGTGTGLGLGTDTDTGVTGGQTQPPFQDTPPVTDTPTALDTPQTPTTQTPTRTPTRTPTTPDGFGRSAFDPPRIRFDTGGRNDAGGLSSSTDTSADVFGTGFADPEDLFGGRDAEEEEEELFGNDSDDGSDVFSASNFF
jgi:hypothetical protein